MAVSEHNGTAYFEQPDNPRSEVNHIVDGDHGTYRGPYRMNRMVVPVVSIDSYAQSHGLAVVDVIKIDAEGHDSVIINGAQETLRDRRVKLLFFEYGADVTWAKRRLQPLVADLDSDFHFDCYFGGELALIKLTGICWKQEYDLWHPRSSVPSAGHVGTNIYCASRDHAPDLIAAYDASVLSATSPRPTSGACHSCLLTCLPSRTRGCFGSIFFTKMLSYFGMFVHFMLS